MGGNVGHDEVISRQTKRLWIKKLWTLFTVGAAENRRPACVLMCVCSGQMPAVCASPLLSLFGTFSSMNTLSLQECPYVGVFKCVLVFCCIHACDRVYTRGCVNM